MRLSDLFGYGEVVLFGRARSGVVALIHVLRLSRDAAFIMPSNLCPSLLLAVHSCGVTVNLASVDKSNGLASDSELVKAMNRAAGPGVVMPSHLYGFVQAYPQVVANAQTAGWFVLENDTVATKTRSAGAARIAFGDALLVSFGYAKGIEAGGGGALLTDDTSLARELRSLECHFPPLDSGAIRAEEEFMLFDRQLRTKQFQGAEITGREREQILFQKAPGCRYRFPDVLELPLASAIDRFPAVLEDRRRRVEQWDCLLAPYSGKIMEAQADCVTPWRLIRRVPGARDSVVSALRDEGIDAGTNFPPLTSSFPTLLAGQCDEGAEQWGREVLNLWLTPTYDATRMKRAVDVIGAVLSREGESK